MYYILDPELFSIPDPGVKNIRNTGWCGYWTEIVRYR
jgi:hypothetical protein